MFTITSYYRVGQCTKGTLIYGLILGEKFLSNFISSRDRPVRKTETRQGWETLRTLPTTEWWRPPLWPQHNALESLVNFVHNKLNYKDASALRWRPERRPPSFSNWHSAHEFSHPCHVSVLFTGPFLLEMKFYKDYSPSFCSFLWCF